jgi:aminoglycoside phosphotransferase (APT) family kinase protein
VDVERFQSFLDAVEPERGATVLSAEPIPGGYSRDTVRAEVQWADGTRETFVLRGDPPEDMSVFRSDRDAEWTLLQALKDLDTLTIPTPRYYDATGEYLGCKCIVSEAIESTSMQKYLDAGQDFEQAREDFITIIASAHTTPVDLIDASVPRPTDWREHLDSVIAIFDRAIAMMGEDDPILRYTVKKLRMNIPPEVPMTLVHGDIQPGNFLLSEGVEPHIIDWEFSKIGDPRLDIGYYLQIPMPPQLYYPDPDAFLAIYREKTGLTEEQLNPAIAKFFLALGTIHLMEDILVGMDDVANGEHRGVMGTYLMLAAAHFHNLYLDVALGLPLTTEAAQ